MLYQVTGRHVSEHPLDTRLRLLGNQVSAESRLEVIWSYFEEATGQSVSRPPTHDERLDVVQWFRKRIVDADEWVTFSAKWPVLQSVAYETMTAKAGRIRQMPCLSCELAIEEDGRFPLHVGFALDIEPWTAQSSADRVKIRETAAEAMRKKQQLSPTSYPVCISIVSLVRHGSAIKDADNLVKGLLDSFEGTLYRNDRQIQCLTARRVEYRGPTGAYFVQARAVRPWDVDVLCDDGKPPIILG